MSISSPPSDLWEYLRCLNYFICVYKWCRHCEVGSYNNDTQDKLLRGGGGSFGDEEMGLGSFSETHADKVGPYQFVWADGEDFYNGYSIDDTEKTDVSTSKVGRNGSQDHEEL